jgi:hypothetical protein
MITVAISNFECSGIFPFSTLELAAFFDDLAPVVGDAGPFGDSGLFKVAPFVSTSPRNAALYTSDCR